jgi:hypothetical protein
LTSFHSATEALEFVTLSARIISDIRRALDHKSWSLHWVVREWIPLPVGCEFRGIARNKQLNAVTQYDSQLFFSDVLASKDSIARYNSFSCVTSSSSEFS